MYQFTLTTMYSVFKQEFWESNYQMLYLFKQIYNSIRCVSYILTKQKTLRIINSNQPRNEEMICKANINRYHACSNFNSVVLSKR